MARNEVVTSVASLEEGDEVRWGDRKTFATVVDDDHYSCHTKWVKMVDNYGNEYTARTQNDLAWGTTLLINGDVFRAAEVRR